MKKCMLSFEDMWFDAEQISILIELTITTHTRALTFPINIGGKTVKNAFIRQLSVVRTEVAALIFERSIAESER